LDIIRRGLFRVSLGYSTQQYRAINEAEAMYKFAKYLGIENNPFYSGGMDVEVIEPTIREFD
jgi:hypothetical protein